MGRIISESYNSYDDNNVLNEGFMSFKMSDLAEYVTREDERINVICESLGFNIDRNFSNVDIDRHRKLMSIKEGNETLKLFLKNSIINDMDNYFRYKF